MVNLRVNLACGNVYVERSDWINLDYAPSNPAVKQADLLAKLPFKDEKFDVVYSSHFIEHIPKSQVVGFLRECFRILAPGGLIRLVLPDFEEMCREYLLRRGSGEHEKADFLVVEIIDQCVRLRPGGELLDTYRRIAKNSEKHADMVEYIRFRTGETLGFDRVDNSVSAARNIGNKPSSLSRFITNIVKLHEKVSRRVQRVWFNWLIGRLPSAFHMQNVSFATVGERHHWLWDFHQLTNVLIECGYADIKRCQAATSRITDFPFFPLDLDERGQPRKGADSIYVEAVKSC